MAYGDGYSGGYAGPTGLVTTCEVAFATDPGDPSPAWTDITEYLMGFTVRRGRADEPPTQPVNCRSPWRTRTGGSTTNTPPGRTTRM
jgi:hypothetical protein